MATHRDAVLGPCKLVVGCRGIYDDFLYSEELLGMVARGGLLQEVRVVCSR